MKTQKPQLRISPSLLDSFDYYLSIDDPEQSEKKRQELLAYLRGEKKTSEAMQDGLDFEADVLAVLNGQAPSTTDAKLIDCIEEVASIVRGGTYQHHAERELDGVLLHGFQDWLNRNVIYDVKTTGKYEIGKYNTRNQHRIYLYCLQPYGIDRFSYLVTDFKNVYREDYQWLDSYEDDLRANVQAWFDYLENDQEMKQAYYQKMEAANAQLQQNNNDWTSHQRPATFLSAVENAGM